MNDDFKWVTSGTPGAVSSSTPRGTNRYSPHARARTPGRISGAVWARPGRGELAPWRVGACPKCEAV